MATSLISIRTARPEDAPDIARAHREAWRYAYQGHIAHLPLERMIARRGAGWWQRSLESGMHALALDFDGDLAGYATLGRSRMRGTPSMGEIVELSVRAVFPGRVGAGTVGRRRLRGRP